MKITLTLTVPQALLLRELAGNNLPTCNYFTGAANERAVFLRAMCRLEDAIEQARGYAFANRFTTRGGR